MGEGENGKAEKRREGRRRLVRSEKRMCIVVIKRWRREKRVDSWNIWKEKNGKEANRREGKHMEGRRLRMVKSNKRMCIISREKRGRKEGRQKERGC